MLTISGIDGLRERTGQELGVSAWHTITQAHIDAFADATEDHAQIHVDPDHALQTPLRGTIAHGLYTLSLGPKFLYEIFALDDIGLALNYGYDRVRFMAPVPVDSRIRMRATLASVDEVDGGVRATIEQVFEREGQEKPVCVARGVALYYERA